MHLLPTIYQFLCSVCSIADFNTATASLSSQVYLTTKLNTRLLFDYELFVRTHHTLDHTIL
jgi:hypothetical protein